MTFFTAKFQTFRILYIITALTLPSDIDRGPSCAGTTSRHSSGSDVSSSSYEQSCNNGEIPSLKDLSAEAAARGELRKVLIVDARSYAAAVGNRARGGGVECPEYYLNAEIQFMNLANIHSIRKSFQALRSLCHAPPDQTSWFQALDSTKWLHHMSGLLKASVRCVTALQVTEFILNYEAIFLCFPPVSLQFYSNPSCFEVSYCKVLLALLL